jgi:hypothetical protein
MLPISLPKDFLSIGSWSYKNPEEGVYAPEIRGGFNEKLVTDESNGRSN